ncbi:LOW QUALITY PROTEIN: probable 2-oxoglutarate dehydrogenase E1 component DHKTD1, mitochondrial [Pollicipes pollicipes]|uniref:LOW QUALITY PROTEIN: probable 2-oxoglutarate dehydrogenase E1 component DHKTD1, mitochondrial n=1 Tax=Pollicipes pollicipes TaxID=41117 RepID=UPI00188498ED|nr:LOW QUALITY PROTEIN: probable 2-oxoglutarate dehydrogenase E1 component DHKTD1, mitochondrial [Pollicipes pollicipes]
MHKIWHTISCARCVQWQLTGRQQLLQTWQPVRQQQLLPVKQAATQNRHYHANDGVYGYKPPKASRFQVSTETLQSRAQQAAVYRLVEAYRSHGHKVADYNPLAPREVKWLPELDLGLFCLAESDPVSPAGLVTGCADVTTVGQLVDLLRTVYCGRLSAQFAHVSSAEEQEWLAERLEWASSEQLAPEERLRLAETLLHSQVLDKFLAVKFATVKRYGGEGAEATGAFLAELLMLAARADLREVVMGMAHRGRLNLLTDLLQYPPVQMFQKMRGMCEFPDGVQGIGDVLSHLNRNVDLEIEGKTIHAVLLSNPSHLEAVNPVAMGRVRGREQTAGEGDYSSHPGDAAGDRSLCLQIHGDAAMSAQGIIQEALAISDLPHTRIGGSIHLAINNQLGYTTPEARGRSSTYCTDIAKLVDAPVIRVNGDYPEEVVRACRMAFEYRQRFRRDVFVDLVCFRRWGHNELDDPTLTNPAMYRNIHTRVSVPDRYVDSLMEDGLMTLKDVEDIQTKRYNWLNEELAEVDTHVPKANHLEGLWSGLRQAPAALTSWDTGVDVQLLKYIGGRSVEWPTTFSLHPHLQKSFVKARRDRLRAGEGLDWATCEALALGSLLYEGNHVRLCGQDVGRGTFSQRHVMLVDQKTDHVHVPLNSLTEQQTTFLEVVNSALTEEAMLAFEYGVSVESPHRLCIWEAQFGDFFNGAQIPIDTMITSGEAKWLYQTALTLVLPHGMDGTGPEHSSCRMERFLQLTDSREDAVDGDNVNLHIINPTTPAQYFHALRRQMVRDFRKPLVVVGPKMLLRYPAAVSSLADMAPGTQWQPVIDDAEVSATQVRTLVFCSGKHYYALAAERAAAGRQDVALVRLEQLTPFPTQQLNDIRDKYSRADKFIWSQEEHRNQGAWTFVRPRFYNLAATKLQYCGREVLCAPATGTGRVHQQEAKRVVQAPFQT